MEGPYSGNYGGIGGEAGTEYGTPYQGMYCNLTVQYSTSTIQSSVDFQWRCWCMKLMRVENDNGVGCQVHQLE